jgi:hypothetical protein
MVILFPLACPNVLKGLRTSREASDRGSGRQRHNIERVFFFFFFVLFAFFFFLMSESLLKLDLPPAWKEDLPSAWAGLHTHLTRHYFEAFEVDTSVVFCG